MKMELNDETLTAYALGELDAAETKAVEKLLADAAHAGNDAPRKALEEIRAAIEVSTAAFAGATPDAALTHEQREEVHAAAEETATRRVRGSNRIWLGLAATVLLLIGVAVMLPALSRAREAYRSPETAALMEARLAARQAEEAAATLRPATPLETPTDELRYQAALPEVVAPAPEASSVPAHQPEPIPAVVPSAPETNVEVGFLVEAAPESAIADPNMPVPASNAVADTTTPERAQGGGAAGVVAGGRLSVVAGVEVPADGVVAESLGKAKDDTATTGQAPVELKEQIADLGTTITGTPTPEAQPPAQPIEWRRRPRPEAAEPKKEAAVSINATATAAASPAAPAAPRVQRLGLSTVAEQEQLKSLGYIDDSQNRAPVLGGEVSALGNFQMSRIEARDESWRYRQPTVTSQGTEAYAPIADAPFVRVADQPLSTFSIDVDTASYSNMRRYLQEGQLPPPNAVRVEELVNYFDYAYPAPTDGQPFASHFEAVACPWAPEHTLVRIGLKGREVPRAERPASNLVFLIDVSGSMQPENKLPLVKRAMAMLTRQLDERDRVTIVTYASGVNLALPVTNAANQDRVLSAIENLGAGGSTNGAGGIQLAYESARRNFLPGGTNRVILATDGDFNVGISDNDSLLALIQQEAKSDVFLSVFGFGMGNLKDDKLELLADKGNGVYGYIDSESEARKVFVEKLSGTLVTIAKDVKVQVEFNPARVGAYRLVGYENRALAAQDFNDDRKDAGEIGAGHTVTALYEVVPVGMAVPAAGSVDPLRYQSNPQAVQLDRELRKVDELVAAGKSAEAVAHLDVLRNQYTESFDVLTQRIISVKQAAGLPLMATEQAAIAAPNYNEELLLVKLRYKEPEGATSQLLEFPLKDQKAETMSADLKFATAVAAFGKMLRGNQLGSLNYDGMMQLAQAGLAASGDPHRAEMIHLMLTARPLLEVRWEMPAVATSEISLVDLREVNGEWRARIRTGSRTSWREVSEQFEKYTLLAIIAENGCVIVYDDSTRENTTLCLSAGSAQ